MRLKKLAAVLFVICAAALLERVECKSFFGIGTRTTNDQLLMKDVLQARLGGLQDGLIVAFNYAIPEPITYIEICSEENVLAEVNFSYQHDLVKGNVTAVSDLNATYINGGIETLKLQIQIYGFNESVLNVNPSYILNRDQQFEGILEPEDSSELEYEMASNEGVAEFSIGNEETTAETENYDIDYIEDFASTDKIIEQGRRQRDDYLLYETFQTSRISTEEPTNHSVIFYYIDSNYITYVRFIIFDHTVDKPPTDYNPPIAEYTHFSPNTLKAIIMDDYTTNLFVQMLIYGYQPADLPIDFEPFLTSSIKVETKTESPPSALERLRILINAKSQKVSLNSEEDTPDEGEIEYLSTTSAPMAASSCDHIHRTAVAYMVILYFTTCW